MEQWTFLSSLLGLLLLCIKGTKGGEFCYTYYSSYSSFLSYYTSEYCDFGCCGTTYNNYCCPGSVGLVVGCVVGGIFLISGIIAVICCCVKKQGHAGRVVHPATSGVAVVSYGASTNNTTYGYQQPAPSAPPGQHLQPAYGTSFGPPPAQTFSTPTYGQPPPAYTYSDPVYPPAAPAGTTPGVQS